MHKNTIHLILSFFNKTKFIISTNRKNNIVYVDKTRIMFSEKECINEINRICKYSNDTYVFYNCKKYSSLEVKNSITYVNINDINSISIALANILFNRGIEAENYKSVSSYLESVYKFTKNTIKIKDNIVDEKFLYSIKKVYTNSQNCIKCFFCTDTKSVNTEKINDILIKNNCSFIKIKNKINNEEFICNIVKISDYGIEIDLNKISFRRDGIQKNKNYLVILT